ncbi:sporulation protein kinase [Trichophyton mentagrophytes]|nr:sporulation protein kinase [Trichophyton mentagrophytes]
MASLEDRFQVLKEVGDGSFGSVALARVRTAGSNVARRGTMVAIKTMKKTYNSFTECLDLREVVFLRSLPQHPHLVPAYDIFLDPGTKKLHICMEYMDGNLYQLMKAREHKPLEPKAVKSILFQILSGLDHIHAHQFFHRDIKPENILVSSNTSLESSSSTFSRYSHLVTPPSTPSNYTVKIADFGLARETHSKRPYTNYVSTRWYRAPEVLLRAGAYSAPVDMWAVGAMAVEIATLKPLFPGKNEIDQVWRVCEIMGSPGNWYSKNGARVGGGEWRDGIKLAQRLGFSFPKMAPHALETILPTTHWPLALSQFVTWCLMWDPKARPTSTQALNHEYFTDAVDPLRPKSSTARLLGRRQSDKNFKVKDADTPTPTLVSKPSWFRRSIIGATGRESPVLANMAENTSEPASTNEQQATMVKVSPEVAVQVQVKTKSKRATWANGAPMPILPSIRPVSPLSNAVTAQGNSHANNTNANSPERKAANQNGTQQPNPAASKKVARQLSVNSNGNHYSDAHRAEAERALNGSTATTPTQKESFFSHLRKRARRLSGRNQTTIPADDVEANAANAAWSGPTSNRSSMAIDPITTSPIAKQSSMAKGKNGFADLDKALQDVKYSLDKGSSPQATSVAAISQIPSPAQSVSNAAQNPATGPISSRTRRALQLSSRPVQRYETPEEEDELLQEVLYSTSNAARHLLADQPEPPSDEHVYHQQQRQHHLQQQQLRQQQQQQQQQASNTYPFIDTDLDTQMHHTPSIRTVDDSCRAGHNPYPTPSPTARRDGLGMNMGLNMGMGIGLALTPDETPSKPMAKGFVTTNLGNRQGPTPPYDDNQWPSAVGVGGF